MIVEPPPLAPVHPGPRGIYKICLLSLALTRARFVLSLLSNSPTGPHVDAAPTEARRGALHF